jgi:hypothetical protein
MTARSVIEYHPENGHSPYVVVTRVKESELWRAFRTREEAERELPKIESWWRAAIDRPADPM